MGNNTDKKMEVRRTRNKLATNLDKLEGSKISYIEKAKEALKRGDKHSYSLARSGLAATLAQLQRTREMLLNIDITMQMRDTGETTEEFLTSMETIFKRISKINKSVDIKSARTGLRNAITGMENVQEQLDMMLMESEEAFADLSQSGAVSDAEIDKLLGVSAAVAEETDIGAEIDAVISSVEKEKAEAAEKEAPKMYTVGTSGSGEQPAPKSAPIPTPAPAPKPMPAPEQPAPVKKKIGVDINSSYDYEFPPLDLLDDYALDAEVRNANERALEADAEAAESLLSELGVPAKVVSRTVGPAFSRLEMVMPTGMSVQKVEPLLSDLSMRLGKQTRFEIPIPGKNAFGIEVPNLRRETVGLKELVGSDAFVNARGGVDYCLAVDIERKPVVKDLTKAPHVIIAGSTGSGKSCFFHSVITSLMYKYTPAQLRLAIIDFKRVEMAVYNGLPYLVTDKVVDDEEDALELFNKLNEEMENRYEMFTQLGCRNIGEYNEQASGANKLPYVAVFVDEYADIATSTLSKEFDAVLRRLSQKARASGIHLVLATQRPSTDVISGTIKNNFPVQIAFKVGRKEDSRTTLAGKSGAETLLGNGDMLYNGLGESSLHRMQAPFVSSAETRRIADWVITHSRKN